MSVLKVKDPNTGEWVYAGKIYGDNADLTGYATEQFVRDGYQPKGNYLTEHQDISGKLDSSALPTAINTALAQAKASGEFDGKDGKDGADGYTPVKGVDYFDGKDGKDGSNGKDGVSATHSWNGTVLTVTSASGTSSADLKGEKGDKGDKGDSVKGDKGDKGDTGATGSSGKDGTSVTHSWSGTTLTVTSASGTSSANLKGEKGDTGGTGAAGTSVTVKYVSESTADGGSNVVTFSDGKTVTIKNGSRGSMGATGSDGKDGEDGYTPVAGVDYYTDADKAEFSAYIASELAKRGQLKPEFANSIAECTDTTKPYVLPDGYIYAYVLTETDPEPLFTNKIEGATITRGKRYSLSSAAFKEQTGCDAVVFTIPSSGSITIRLRNCEHNTNYMQVYGGKSATAFSTAHVENNNGWTTDSSGDQVATFTNSAGNTYVCVMMNTVDTSKAIVTVNEEIKWSAGGTGYAWANTGHAFVPADYESRILDIEKDVSAQAKQISNLEKKVENIGADESEEAAYNRMRNWQYPIFEDAPVFLLSENKPALTASDMTTAGIYAKYDALMAANSHYITRVNCGTASDGTTPIYAYHFRQPEPHYLHNGSTQWTEKKPTFLVCSGVHPLEQTGIHSMFHALEEITTNPELFDLKRNLHIIVFPMLNPTAFEDDRYHMRNPDGVQVHHNFEVGHGENGAVQGDRYYGGATPLSIPETQYFDAVMEEYKDSLVCVLSCHNNELDERHGTGVIWCSCATHFTCNLGFRFADKMSIAWREKHGAEVFDAGIRWANDFVLAQYENPTISDFEWMFDIIKPDVQPEWDYLVGRSNMSGSGGTEYRQALKYGVHGVNVESCPRCMILDRDYNAKNTSNAITMGTETYINYFRTFMAAYATVEKDDYAPNLPWSE